MARPAVKQVMPARLVPRLHDPVDDRPFYDTELDVGQSDAHSIMAIDLASIFGAIALDRGLQRMSDQSMWFLHPQDDRQQVAFNDLVLLKEDADISRVTAEDALVVAEVVTTTERRKEVKDTRFQLAMNEYNQVPEFALFFPELEDERSLRYFRLNDQRLYDERSLEPGQQIMSRTIMGLAFRVMPRDKWTPGRKVEVILDGELRPPLEGERARAEEARREAEQARAETEQAQAETKRALAETKRAHAEREQMQAALDDERTRAERLAARLRAMGLDPDLP